MASDDSLHTKSPMTWQKEVPYDTRQEAISDAITAVKGCLTKIQRGLITHFNVRFRSRKNQTSQAFRVNKKAIDLQTMEIFKRRLCSVDADEDDEQKREQKRRKEKKEMKKQKQKNKKKANDKIKKNKCKKKGKSKKKRSKKTAKKKKSVLRMRKRDRVKMKTWFGDKKHPDGNFTVLKTRPGHWYLCLPHESCDLAPTEQPYHSVYLDPGQRSFQTFYSPEGVCGKIGGSVFNDELEALAKSHDALWATSDTAGCSKATKKNMRERCALLRLKMKNKVSDLHAQACSFLCRMFKYVFLPKFQVSEMVEGSPLGSSVTRKLLQLSHGAFRERITHYAKAKRCGLFIVGEGYTTKTCGCCGHIQEVGNAKVYACQRCRQKIDRDYNAARNICLRIMTQMMM